MCQKKNQTRQITASTCRVLSGLIHSLPFESSLIFAHGTNDRDECFWMIFSTFVVVVGLLIFILSTKIKISFQMVQQAKILIELTTGFIINLSH